MSSSLTYRPEIDGLLALAVLAVLFFHAGLGFPGGYVGVDIFFVISGYLITSIIHKDLQAGAFSLVNFWERRARRILPAGIVMVLATMVAGWFLLLPSDFTALGKSAVAQSLFSANLYFWRTTNYFAGPADEQPLLHTWSLAVEEQFYMVVPLLLMGLFYSRFPRIRIGLVAVGMAGLVASFALSVWLLPRMHAATFYLLPTRAWEMLCGSIIALMPAEKMPQSRWIRETLVTIGLAGMILPCVMYSKAIPFPGLAAVPVCLGAMFFIVGCTPLNLPRSAPPPSFPQLPVLARLFTWRPVVFIGLISYSLYLWHWPLVAFSHYWSLEETLPLVQRWLIVGASLVLAILSWKYVETPFRVRRLGTTRRSMFTWATAGMTVVLVVGLVFIRENGFPGRFSETVIAFDQVLREHRDNVDRTTVASVKNDMFPRIGAPSPAPVGLLVWGDSHANAIIPGLVGLPEIQNVGVEIAWHPATPPVLNRTARGRLSLRADAPDVANAVLDRVRREGIPNVLLIACWDGYVKEEADESTGETFASAFEQTVSALHDAGCRVYVLRQVPRQKIPVTKALMMHEIFRINLQRHRVDEKSYLEQVKPMDDLVNRLASPGATMLDPSPILYDPAENCFPILKDGASLYTDNDHISAAAAKLISPTLLTPLLLDCAL